jgi:ATP-binding cassette subfamily C protein
MLKAIRASLSFMTPNEKSKWFFLTGLRSFLSLLDLAGILAIGFVVTSTAIFLTSGSDPDRVLEFAGFRIPAVNAKSLPWISVAVLILFLSKALFSVILIKRVAFFVATIEARSAMQIARICFGGDIGDARKRSREEIMYAIQGGSPAAFNGLLNAVNIFATEATLFVVICLGFFFVDPLATLAAVIYFGCIALVIQYFIGSRMAVAGEVAAQGAIRANMAISDLLAVFRELLVLDKREKYLDVVYKARLSAADSAATQYYLGGMPRYVIEAALLVGVALFVLSQALSGDVVKSAATLGVFISGGFRLTAAILPLQSSLLSIKSILPSAKLAHDILQSEPRSSNYFEDLSRLETGDEPESRNVKDVGPMGINFQSVGFSYPNSDQPAVTDLTFEVEAGTQLALMGPSGAGKSTIADLLCGVLTPMTGTITTKGSTVSDSVSGFSGRASYVPQRPGLVSGTILDNVALAEDSEKVDRRRALEALELAHLGDLVSQLPEGLDAPLGKLQDGLSGGQMQRLGLARALYTKPGLLVMDEATSALDAESEAEIQKALDGMRGKVTVVLIAHRLNTIQHADKVILIEEGKVKDSGTFKDLIRRNPSVERVVDLMRVDKS